MTESQSQERSQPASRTLALPTVIAGAFLALHVVTLFWRPNPLWGIDLLYYLPAPVQVLFLISAVFLFIPGFRRQVRAVAATLPFALWGRGCRVWATRALVLFVALAAFATLHSSLHLLGDGYHVLEKLDAENRLDLHRAPLTKALIRTVHEAGGALWKTKENTYRVYSFAAGVLYVLIAFALAAALGETNRDKSIVLAFLLSTGYMQIFFGYVENYALHMPCFLLYLLLGIHTFEQRLPLFFPAFMLGILLALHQAFFVVGPSFLILAYRSYRIRKGSRPILENVTSTIAAICCVPLVTGVFLVLNGVGFEDYLSGMDRGDVLPLFGDPGFQMQYRMFSLAHVLDFINQQLLSAPAACMALFLLRKTDFVQESFLAAAAAFPLFFTFVANPNLGAFRDWDVLSLPALPFTLLMAAAFLKRIRDREQRFHSACLFCGAAGLHTVLWIGLNASAGPAEARFTGQLGRLTGYANANGWVTLAKFQRRQQNVPAALEAYKRALKADPTNTKRWIIVGTIYREIGNSASAIEFYEKAVELQPDNALPYLNLGAAYSDLGQFAKAIEYTRKAIAIQPDNATAHGNLGAIYRKAGQVSKAIEHLEKTAALRPDHAAALGNLGAMYREAGKYTRAITALKKAVTTQPEDATDYLNLGVVYYDIGQFDNAIEYLDKALEINPGYVLAYVNIGYAYKRQGKYPLAIEYFEKALELQTGSSQFQTFLIIGDTYYKMSELEKAIPYFQKAIRLNPDHGELYSKVVDAVKKERIL